MKVQMQRLNRMKMMLLQMKRNGKKKMNLAKARKKIRKKKNLKLLTMVKLRRLSDGSVTMEFRSLHPISMVPVTPLLQWLKVMKSSTVYVVLQDFQRLPSKILWIGVHLNQWKTFWIKLRSIRYKWRTSLSAEHLTNL